MINLPSLRQFQYLIALHKYNHFKQAADACGVSQSTLSAGIVQLEGLLECQLLERAHKKFIFTALGEQVAKDARNLVQAGIDIQRYTKSYVQPMSGQLVLGCIETIAPFVLPAIVKNTSKQYPELSLLLAENTASNLLEALEFGEVDMVLMALPFKAEGFTEVVLAEDHFSLVMHNNIAENYGNDFRKLPDQSLYLMADSHCFAEQVKNLCRLPEVDKQHHFAANSLQSLVQMIEMNQGVTFLPQMAINSQILSGTDLVVRRAEPLGAHRKVCLLWRQSNKRVTTFDNLALIISEVVRSKCVRNQPF